MTARDLQSACQHVRAAQPYTTIVTFDAVRPSRVEVEIRTALCAACSRRLLALLVELESGTSPEN